MLPIFMRIEDSALGAGDVRGVGGPLHVSTVDGADPLLEDVLEGGRAVGVQGRRNGQGFEARATRAVILAAGSIATPKILQLSGIGPVDTLRSAGVDVVVDSPNVGARMREHLAFMMQFRLAEDLGYNKVLSTEAGQQAAAEEYRATRRGPLAPRVRGVTNLRVVDASILPIMISGNLNGAVSALAWRAADIIAT
jgi:choline dehydrogenase-like flavoprotein